VSLTYESSASYDIITANTGTMQLNQPTGTMQIAPTDAGHSLIAIDLTGGASTLVSLTDSAGESFVIHACQEVTNRPQICFASIDRAAAGVSWVSPTYTNSYGGHNSLTILEVRGIVPSGAFDQSHIDSAYDPSPFVSGNTGTTTQAAELLVGAAFDDYTYNNNGQGLISCDSLWIQLMQGGATMGQGTTRAFEVCVQGVTSTGAYHLSGTSADTGPTTLPGLVTFKLSPSSLPAQPTGLTALAR